MNEVDIKNILTSLFGPQLVILGEIQAGLRCKTFLIEENGNKKIFQIYFDNTIYQAEKKFNILKLFDLDEIPKAYEFDNCTEYSYLITEYKDGKNLSSVFKNSDFNFMKTIDKLTCLLAKIHSFKNDKFGWITDKEVFESDSLDKYIDSECRRLSKNLNGLNVDLKENILNKVYEAVQVVKKISPNISNSCLCWYDINPDNILVKNDGAYELNAILDPGGVRYGVPEWDLAFIKMEVCKNEEQFNYLIECYEKYTNYNIDLELLQALTVIVELDDMAIRIVDKIDLDIPFASNFKDEIAKL